MIIVDSLNFSKNDKIPEKYAVTDRNIKRIKVGSRIHHEDFDYPVTVTKIIKSENPIYNKPYGFSGLEVKSTYGALYDLWINNETLRLQNRIGDDIKKWIAIE